MNNDAINPLPAMTGEWVGGSDFLSNAKAASKAVEVVDDLLIFWSQIQTTQVGVDDLQGKFTLFKMIRRWPKQ